MKILHVIPAVAARYGGPSKAIYEMCRALQTRGEEIVIATTDADGAHHLPVKHREPILFHEVPTIFFRHQFSAAFKYSKPLSRWLDSHVAEFDAVHIHAVFSHACLAAAKACQRHKVPYVVRPLGTLDPWSLSQKSLRKKLFWRFGAEEMLREAAAIHYTAPDEKLLVERSLGLGKGTVIPLGVCADVARDPTDAGKFRERHDTLGDHPYVLTLSRLHPKKNLELLMTTFLELKKHPVFNNWKLVIAGDGDSDYVNSLQILARELGGNGGVLFPGWLDGAEKISALQNAALLALISSQENFGLCLVESLACRVPVLVSKHVNIASQIDEAGVGWVTELAQANLSHKFEEILSNPDERERRGTRGQDFVRGRFTWTSVAVELEALYRSMAKKSVAA